MVELIFVFLFLFRRELARIEGTGAFKDADINWSWIEKAGVILSWIGQSGKFKFKLGEFGGKDSLKKLV